MKFLIWLLVLAAAAVTLAHAAHNPGYVLVVFQPYRIEMSLTLFTLGLLALFGFGYGALRLVSAAVRLPAYVRGFRAERAERQSRAALMEALGAYFEGRFAAAERAALRAMEQRDHSGLAAIVAARAAHEQRAFDKRDAYLEAAEGRSPGEDTMRLLTRTRFMLDQKQPDAALSALKTLREGGVKNHIGALQLELKAQQLARNWDAVLETLEQLEKREAVDATTAEQMRRQAWMEKLRAQQDGPGLHTVWRAMPDKVRKLASVAAVAARAFIHLDEGETARELVTQSLAAQWESDLAALYGDCKGSDPLAQIEQAEAWLKLHPRDAGLLLALGKLCLRQELWGKAQIYLEASLSLAPARAAYTALGQLAEKLHKPDEAFAYYQKAMEVPGEK